LHIACTANTLRICQMRFFTRFGDMPAQETTGVGRLGDETIELVDG